MVAGFSASPVTPSRAKRLQEPPFEWAPLQPIPAPSEEVVPSFLLPSQKTQGSWPEKAQLHKGEPGKPVWGMYRARPG